MQEIWLRIEDWLRDNAPKCLDVLASGASDTQISELEEHLSIQLPEDVKASYRIHNGQTAYEYGLFNGCEFLSLERIKNEWQIWKDLLDSGTFQSADGQDQGCDPDLGVANVWWSAKWIPLTYDGSGNHDCLDLAPAEGGKVGQIISMWHDDAERKIIAPSFRDWLQSYAEGLESGKFVFSDEYNGIVNVDDVAFI
jgi:cell wall assembly regulator SMI1